MFRIDHPTAVPAMPALAAPGAPGYFTGGDPATALPATVVTADWANEVQEEIVAVIAAAGLALTKGDTTQLYKAIAKLGTPRWVVLATGTVLTAGVRLIPDNTAAAVSYTLPAAPADGDVIEWRQGATSFATNPVAFDPGGNTIMGRAGVMTVDSPNDGGSLIWRAALNTWRVYATSIAGA